MLTGGSGLAGVDMSDDDEVDVSLLFLTAEDVSDENEMRIDED